MARGENSAGCFPLNTYRALGEEKKIPIQCMGIILETQATGKANAGRGKTGV